MREPAAAALGAVCAGVLAAMTAGAAPCAAAESLRSADVASPFSVSDIALDREVEDRLLALTPEHISDAEVQQVLARAPAPRIINLQGITGFVTMAPFAEYLIAMGYPEERVRNPRDGGLSYSSFVDSENFAGALAWYYEHEGMMPMLIGHSRGGAAAVRVLHELAGGFSATVSVWNPLRDEAEARTAITDPLTGEERPVVGLKVPYAAAIATGPLPRIILGEWAMLSRLHVIPDSVEEFSGYSLDWDLIAGNFGSAEPYRAAGTAQVRNIVLPPAVGHITAPLAKPLALDPVTRAWIDDYAPGPIVPPLPSEANVDLANLLHAADIWYSIKKHWCLEAQRLIRAKRRANAAQAKP
jgi:hypothetical protein